MRARLDEHDRGEVEPLLSLQQLQRANDEQGFDVGERQARDHDAVERGRSVKQLPGIDVRIGEEAGLLRILQGRDPADTEGAAVKVTLSPGLGAFLRGEGVVGGEHQSNSSPAGWTLQSAAIIQTIVRHLALASCKWPARFYGSGV